MKFFTKIILFFNIFICSFIFCAEDPKLIPHDLSSTCMALYVSFDLRLFNTNQIKFYFSCEKCKSGAFLQLEKNFSLGYKKIKNIAKLFIKNGANINGYSQDESLPLNYACSKLNVGAVKLFISLGADVNKKERGHTPLYTVINHIVKDCEKGIDIIGILLAAEANPNIKCEKLEDCPLALSLRMYVFSPNLRKILKKIIYWLLICGADPNIENKGYLIEDYPKLKNFFDYVKYFPSIADIYEKSRKICEEKGQYQMYEEDLRKYAEINLIEKNIPKDVINIINEY